jgi:hypothetical protein
MSTNLLIRSNFIKLQQTLKYTDNQRITDTDIYIFICILVHICVYAFCRCYTLFGAHPKYMHIKTFVNILNKSAHTRINVGAPVFNAGLLARSQFVIGNS